MNRATSPRSGKIARMRMRMRMGIGAGVGTGIASAAGRPVVGVLRPSVALVVGGHVGRSSQAHFR